MPDQGSLEGPSSDPEDARELASDPRGQDHWLRWLLPPAVVLLLIILVRSFLVAPFSIPSGSMEHTLDVGDRILVNRTIDAADLQRGDIIVFDARDAFGVGVGDRGLLSSLIGAAGSLVGVGPETDYVKRIVGLPGDRVVCCASDGRLTVNGVPATEPYLFPGDAPSSFPFDVTVPAGKLWVMGDHRSRSADSRAHLGSPGGGMVPLGDVIGRATVRYWPLDRAGSIEQGQLSSIPRNGT
ncbi:MAG: signal peptidase I [Dermatophilaceae bacterium]